MGPGFESLEVHQHKGAGFFDPASFYVFYRITEKDCSTVEKLVLNIIKESEHDPNAIFRIRGIGYMYGINEIIRGSRAFVADSLFKIGNHAGKGIGIVRSGIRFAVAASVRGTGPKSIDS